MTLAGWTNYGHCASHSRYLWGLRLLFITTPSGLPVTYALTSAETDERQAGLDMIDTDPDLWRAGQTLIAGKGYCSAPFEQALTDSGITLIRPASNQRNPGPGHGS